MRLLVHPAARQELHAALRWSRREFGIGTAARLQRRFEQCGELLLREADIGTPAPGETRHLPLGRFPYTLVYRVRDNVVTVIALAHQGRKPGYWQQR